MHAQCLGMRTCIDLPSVPPRSPSSFTGQLRLAVAAYLARFQGSSRYHTESDLRCYLAWCAEHGLDPLTARRPHLELYIRWMQEIRRFKPSTVSRRFSVTAGFYRTCVIDGLLEHSPAEHVRRPSVPAESPTSSERAALEARLKELAAEPVELTMTIGGEHRSAAGSRSRSSSRTAKTLCWGGWATPPPRMCGPRRRRPGRPGGGCPLRRPRVGHG
jgi:hypothetical protein